MSVEYIRIERLQKNKTITAIIPCYNEAKFIGDVINYTKKFVDNVVVVDNGSCDKTALEAKKNGAFVLYSHKKGMGAAISKGLAHIESDFYVTMDGDGQHNPNDIPSLIKPLLDGYDMVVGVRVDNKTMPKYRLLVNRLLSRIYSFGSDIKLDDVQCGFRAFNYKVRNITVKSHGFGSVLELLIKVRKLKYDIKPVNVSCIYHKELNHNSTMNPIKHGLIIMVGAIRWRLWEIFYKV